MKRRFFFCDVPVRYYPLALFALFALLGGTGPSLAYAISMGVGYLFGQGRLDHILKLSSTKAKEWENGVLASFTSRPGWVYGHAALGSDAWSQLPTSDVGVMVSCRVHSRMCLNRDGKREISHVQLHFACQRGLPYFDRDRYLLKAVRYHHRV